MKSSYHIHSKNPENPAAYVFSRLFMMPILQMHYLLISDNTGIFILPVGGKINTYQNFEMRYYSLSVDFSP